MPTLNNTEKKKSRVLGLLNKEIHFLRAIIYIIVIGLILETVIFVTLTVYKSESDEPIFSLIVQKKPKASLYLGPNVAKYKVGEEFNINVFLNTGGSNVVVTSCYLSYNKQNFKAVSVNTDPAFEFVAEKQILEKEGKIKITVGKPTPGVNSKEAKVATIHFKALTSISPQTYDINFDYTPGSTNYSTVILDDKKGTNVLSLTQGANIYVEE